MAVFSSSLTAERLDEQTTKLVDLLMKQAQKHSLLLSLDGCSPLDPVAAKLVTQIIRMLNRGEGNFCLLLWTEELPGNAHRQWENIVLAELDPAQVKEMVKLMLYNQEEPA